MLTIPLLMVVDTSDFIPSSFDAMVIKPLLMVIAASLLIALGAERAVAVDPSGPPPPVVAPAILLPAVVIDRVGILLRSPIIKVPFEVMPLPPEAPLAQVHVTLPPVMFIFPSDDIQVALYASVVPLIFV